MTDLIEGYLVDLKYATTDLLALIPPIDPRSKFLSLVRFPSGFQLTIATEAMALLAIGLARSNEQGCAGIKWHFVGDDATYDALKKEAGSMQRGSATLH